MNKRRTLTLSTVVVGVAALAGIAHLRGWCDADRATLRKLLPRERIRPVEIREAHLDVKRLEASRSLYFRPARRSVKIPASARDVEISVANEALPYHVLGFPFGAHGDAIVLLDVGGALPRTDVAASEPVIEVLGKEHKQSVERWLFAAHSAMSEEELFLSWLSADSRDFDRAPSERERVLAVIRLGSRHASAFPSHVTKVGAGDNTVYLYPDGDRVRLWTFSARGEHLGDVVGPQQQTDRLLSLCAGLAAGRPAGAAPATRSSSHRTGSTEVTTPDRSSRR